MVVAVAVAVAVLVGVLVGVDVLVGVAVGASLTCWQAENSDVLPLLSRNHSHVLPKMSDIDSLRPPDSPA